MRACGLWHARNVRELDETSRLPVIAENAVHLTTNIDHNARRDGIINDSIAPHCLAQLLAQLNSYGNSSRARIAGDAVNAGLTGV